MREALTMLTIMVLLTRRPVRFMWLPRKKACVAELTARDRYT